MNLYMINKTTRGFRLSEIIKMKTINMSHKEQTDEESYQNIKKMYKKHPNVIMKPHVWKKTRLKILKKEGKLWSK